MKLGRNDPCHCGSGKKYKYCHQAADEQARREEDAAARAAAEAAAQATPEPVAAAADPPAADDAAAGAVLGADGEPAAEAGTDAAARHHAPVEHPHKDRTRFRGDSRGGATNFKPRSTRGAQRGS